MRKQASEDRDILVRAITAAAKKLGADSPLFPLVVTWLLDNVPALAGLFGDDSQLFWHNQYLRDPAISRDKHMLAVMKRHGYQSDDLETVRKRYDRWKSRFEKVFTTDAVLGEALMD